MSQIKLVLSYNNKEIGRATIVPGDSSDSYIFQTFGDESKQFLTKIVGFDKKGKNIWELVKECLNSLKI